MSEAKECNFFFRVVGMSDGELQARLKESRAELARAEAALADLNSWLGKRAGNFTKIDSAPPLPPEADEPTIVEGSE